MKKVMEIELLTANDVKEFVRAAMLCPYQIDVCRGRYVVNGKSIMGLFSLNLSETLSVMIPMTASKNYVKSAFKKWEVCD